MLKLVPLHFFLLQITGSWSVPVGDGGWSPNGEDQQPWLQLDLRDRLKVTSIATQGRWGSSDWVSRYQLQYSDSGRTWRPYRQEDVIWVSLANLWKIA